MKLINLLTLLFSFVLSKNISAQGLEETLHQSGKIYVVVLVLTIVFLVLTVFLINLSRKVTLLEKKLLKNQKNEL